MDLKERNKKKNELTVNEFYRIDKIFKEKKWPIEVPFGDNVYDKFCYMLANLEKDQRELLFYLTEKFLWVQEKDYLSYFEKSFATFVNMYTFPRGKKICFCPLLPEEDFGKSKSSVYLLYIIKANLRIIQQKYEEFDITFIDEPRLFNIEIINKGYTLCLLDDFIGTGETAINAAQYFIDQNISIDMISIICLVGMSFGLDILKKKGYNVYTCQQCDKAFIKSEDTEKKVIMLQIEKSIKVRKKYSFGYGSSEALVKMIRTPNNTLPIYWLYNKKNEFAPFPR